jgi:hypothetical protein
MYSNNNNIDPRAFNMTFVNAIGNQGKMDKLAADTGTYIRERVRETSFQDEIIIPKQITALECDRSLIHDEPIKICEIEPNSSAAIVNFRGSHIDKWIEGKRYELSFQKIETETLKKTEAELMAYHYQITAVLEDIMVKEIATVKDTAFISLCNAIIASQGADSETTVSSDFNRDTMAAGKNLLAAYKLNTGCALVSVRDWNIWATAKADDVGNDMATEMVKSGYTSRNIGDVKCIVTNKQEIVLPGTVYFFAPQEFLGESYILSDVKFQIKKDKDLLEMVAWGYYGVGIGNIRGVCKVNLPALVL